MISVTTIVPLHALSSNPSSSSFTSFRSYFSLFFFFKDPPPPEISPLPLHDALPILFLTERRAEKSRERRVEPVEPNHRRGAEVAVVVPGPGRRHYEVAGLHRQFLAGDRRIGARSEEHTSELQSHLNLVCRLLLEKKK